MEKALKLLPLGTSDFENLRHRDQIYVDKTDMICELASVPGKFFFARPRRFGKSLLLSTFESLFRDGLKNFQGLKIEQLWTDKSTYKVIKLDFSRVKPEGTFEDFCQYFDNYLEAQFSLIAFKKKDNGLFLSNQIEIFLAGLSSSSLVLLIDEYDAPLTACLDNKEFFERVRNYLSRFYGILKANDRVLRFLFITGITKFNKTSIFSELNNLSDVSLSPRFGTLLGYTHEEVETYFDGYLTQSASVLSVSRDELLRSLTKQYDGFCFERTTTKKVFAPWSLLKFFSEPEVGLLDYWFESGGRPAALVQYLKSHTLRDPEEYGKEKSIALNLLTGSADVNTLSDIGLLTQAGYLTLKRVVGLTAFVAYPNAEVAAAMAQLYSERLLQGQTLEQVGADNVALRLAEEDPEGVVHLFNRIFTSIDYQNYPVRDEATVRAFIQIFLSGAGFSPHIEVHNSQGRSDLEVTVQNRHFVFEFKVARKEESSEEKLEEGLKQMRKRSNGLQHADQEQLRMVLVFSIPKRKFDKWSVVNPEN